MPPHSQSADPLHRALFGAAAGLAGTLLLQGMMGAQGKIASSTPPPIQRNPGEFFVVQPESVIHEAWLEHLPRGLEKAAAAGLGMGYGVIFGAVYGLLRSERPANRGQTLLEGALLGWGSWVAGYLGWLPAAGLMPPVWKHSAAQAAIPPVEHAVYGGVTAAADDLLRDYV